MTTTNISTNKKIIGAIIKSVEKQWKLKDGEYTFKYGDYTAEEYTYNNNKLGYTLKHPKGNKHLRLVASNGINLVDIRKNIAKHIVLTQIYENL